MTTKFYDKHLNKFSYKEQERDLLKDLRQRAENYNKQLDFYYILKLLINKGRHVTNA